MLSPHSCAGAVDSIVMGNEIELLASPGVNVTDAQPWAMSIVCAASA